MPAVLWPSGRTQRSETWDGLLEEVRSLPWNLHLDAWKLRSVLAKRAYVWSGEQIDAWGPVPLLFSELARVGCLRVLEPPGDAERLRLAIIGDEGDDA